MECKWLEVGGFVEAECVFCGDRHRVGSLGHEAVVLAEIVGVSLDDWQVADLVEAMRVDSAGRWVYTTVCLCISRQNGKGEILQARELYGAVTLLERILHTAHEMATSKNAFERAESLAKRSDLDGYVERYRYANGEQQLEMAGRAGIFYRARTDKAGRGLDDINMIVYDEAQELTTRQLAASSSTSAVAEHQQKWLLGSGGMGSSEVWHGMREDAMRAAGGGTGRICVAVGRTLWIEYTAETVTVIEDDEGGLGRLDVTKPDRHDRAMWALANPAYPHRVSDEFLESELALFASDPDKFDREHLGCWDPRRRTGGRQAKLSADVWAARVEADSQIVSGHVFAVGVDMDQTRAAVYAGGRRADGARHKELLRVDDGTEWVERFLEAAILKNRPESVCIDGSGPARALKATLERVCQAAGVKLVVLSLQDVASACEALVSGVKAGVSWHLGEPHTPRALKKASVRAVGKKWVWEWETAESVCVLGAATVADWCAESVPVTRSAYEDSGLLEV